MIGTNESKPYKITAWNADGSLDCMERADGQTTFERVHARCMEFVEAGACGLETPVEEGRTWWRFYSRASGAAVHVEKLD